MKTSISPLLFVISFCCINLPPKLVAQDPVNGTETTRRNFTREVVLGEDDIFIFPAIPEDATQIRTQIAHDQLALFTYESSTVGPQRVEVQSLSFGSTSF